MYIETDSLNLNWFEYVAYNLTTFKMRIITSENDLGLGIKPAYIHMWSVKY